LTASCKGQLPNPSPRFLSTEGVGLMLIVFAGMAAALDSFATNQLEMLPLVVGLILLLIKRSRKDPLSIGFLFLLFMSLRIYLHTDARYFPWEITLNDYILVLIAFVAAFRVKASEWKLFFTLFSIFVPLASVVSLQIHGAENPEETFTVGALSIQQTSFLIGTCFTISMSFLWNGLSQKRVAKQKFLVIAAWLLVSLLNGFLVVQTKSRAGLGLPMISVAAVVLAVSLPRLNRSVDALILRFSSVRQVARIKIGFALAVLSALGVAVWAFLAQTYASPENLSNDLHRLYLLRCYLGAVFTSTYRFIYGLGFTNTSTWLCDEGLHHGLTHAHNVFAQVAADNGFFALIGLILIAVLLARFAWKLVARLPSPTVLASLAAALYCFLFLQVEGGWGKITYLQALIGLVTASLTMTFDPSKSGTTATTQGVPSLLEGEPSAASIPPQ
jgi:hypothetical protein